MNNCQDELVWLVNNRLRPVKIPMSRITILGPYLSIASPPPKAIKPVSSILRELIEEVKARLKTNSLSIDLKNTPKVNCMPKRAVPMIKKVITTTQP